MFAGIVIGVIAVAFRDMERGEWLAPTLPRGTEEADEEEPVLGYDGMDQETILDWIASADLDDETIEEIIDYERLHRDREPVIEALQDMLG